MKEESGLSAEDRHGCKVLRQSANASHCKHYTNPLHWSILQSQVYLMRLRRSANVFEGQLSTIPPHGTRIISPSTPILSGKKIMNDVWHEERYRRKIMHAALEVPIRGSEHQGSDSLLRIRESESNLMVGWQYCCGRKDLLTLSVSISIFSNSRYAILTRSLSYLSNARSVSISSCKCLVKGSAKASTRSLSFCPS